MAKKKLKQKRNVKRNFKAVKKVETPYDTACRHVTNIMTGKSSKGKKLTKAQISYNEGSADMYIKCKNYYTKHRA